MTAAAAAAQKMTTILTPRHLPTTALPLGLALTLITFLSASSVKVDVAWTCADISQVECLKHFEVGDGCGDWHLWCASDPIPDLGFSDEDNTVRVPIYWSGK
jgi:hypothetical protein